MSFFCNTIKKVHAIICSIIFGYVAHIFGIPNHLISSFTPINRFVPYIV